MYVAFVVQVKCIFESASDSIWNGVPEQFFWISFQITIYSSAMIGYVRVISSADVKASFLLDLRLSWMICGCVIFVLPSILALEGHMDIKRGPPLRQFCHCSSRQSCGGLMDIDRSFYAVKAIDRASPMSSNVPCHRP